MHAILTYDDILCNKVVTLLHTKVTTCNIHVMYPFQCLCPLYSVEGWQITTVEGIGK